MKKPLTRAEKSVLLALIEWELELWPQVPGQSAKRATKTLLAIRKKLT